MSATADTPDTFLYFAYGSNMSSKRLQARTPSAEFVCTATLPGYEMAFDKPGIDGSGKCGIWPSDAESLVQGVVFAIRNDEKSILDRCEGLGIHYDARWLTVFKSANESMDVLAYVPLKKAEGLQPTPEYLDHVLTGAREFGLSQDYIDQYIGKFG